MIIFSPLETCIVPAVTGTTQKNVTSGRLAKGEAIEVSLTVGHSAFWQSAGSLTGRQSDTVRNC